MKTKMTEMRTSSSTNTDWRAALRSPLVFGLGALLVLQLLLALILGFTGRDLEPAGSQGPLIRFDPEQVTGIRIQAADGEPVLVSKTEDGWVIPSLEDLPAAEHKVTGLLTKLEGLRKGLPVATSEEALQRFKVGDRAFERKLTIETGDAQPAILYLGDSPGFRRLFVRADGDSAVHEAELGLFDAPPEADDWSDRSLLHLDKEEVQKLTFPDLVLERTEDAWRITGLSEGEEQDEQAIENAVRDVTSIDFIGVQTTGSEEPTSAEDPAPVQIEATLKSGEALSFRIVKLAEGGDYLLELSNRPQRFTIASYAAEDLIEINRAKLLKETEEATESPAEAPPPADPPAEDQAEANAQAETLPPTPVPEAGEAGAPDPTPADTPDAAPARETPQG